MAAKKRAYFDHFEAHVSDIGRYGDFLVKLFCGGRYKVISTNGTAMFKSDDGINIEIKKKKDACAPVAAGICNPCLRMKGAKEFIEKALGFTITHAGDNPDGKVYFFNDHEGVTWHIKDYVVKDKYINW